MANTHNQQLFSLAEFVNTHWIPAQGEVMAETKTTPQAVMAAARWMENVLWLVLGIEVGAFPSEAGHRLLNRGKTLVRQSLARYERELKTLIAQGSLYLLSQFSAAGTWNLDHFDGPDNLKPHFYGALGLACQMNGDYVGSAFQRALILEREAFWKPNIQGPISFRTVESILARSEQIDLESPSTELFIAGFIRTIESMTQWGMLFANLRGDDDISVADRSGLQRRIGHITRWRLSLDEETTKKRFIESAALACEFVSHESISLAQAVVSKELFMNHVEQVLNNWNQDHELPRSASV